MQISEIGGEFALIARVLATQKSNGSVLVPNGHDAAVVQFGASSVAITTDSVVEGRHWNSQYFSPEQVGMRALEGATSDILAVGGVPRFFTVALVLSADTSVEFVDGLYRGFASASNRLGMQLVGGDTNSGTNGSVVNVTVIGDIPSGNVPRSRSGAKPGDKLFLSGALGGSAAGLAALQSGLLGFEAVKRYHLEPRCRIDVSSSISKIASSVIDISDGLSSEIHHICRASKCGALIKQDKILLKPGVREVASALNLDVHDLVLNGGEEFELLYSVSADLVSSAPGFEIGEIVGDCEVLLTGPTGTNPLQPRGFVHLAS